MEYLNENLKRKKALENRTKRFAVAIFRLLRSLPPSIDSRVIGFQLGKSASSIGANYREANRRIFQCSNRTLRTGRHAKSTISTTTITQSNRLID